jgi:hypothetical protein
LGFWDVFGFNMLNVLCYWNVRPMSLQDSATEFLLFAQEYGLYAGPVETKVKTANPRKKRGV